VVKVIFHLHFIFLHEALEVKEFIERSAGSFGSEEGFRFGNPDVEVRGILVSWMATLEAVEKAVEEDCNLMVVHEDLFYPYSFQRSVEFETCLTWNVNRMRLKMLSEHDITVFRAHGTLDRLCILDDFAKALGLPQPSVKHGYVRIYDIPETTVEKLSLDIKRRLDLKTVRVTGVRDGRVGRVGLAWGGLGLSLNIGFVETLISYRPQVLIAGEMDEYSEYYVLDAGVNMIEVGHSVSENIGLKNFTKMLNQRFPEVKVIFFECPKPWFTL